MSRGTFVLNAALLGALTLALPALSQTLPPPVVLEGQRVFPESLDAGKDGTLYVGSIGKGAVYRAAPGATKATIWLDKAPNKLSAVLGVLADEAGKRLFVCSSDILRLGEPVSLKIFDLASGALKGDYPFPENKGLCNDIAVGKDGTAYVTDTPGAQIFRLKPGAGALELWLADPRWVGIDGLAFGQDGQLYVNNVRDGLHYRVALKADGSAGAVTPLKTSRPLEGPDGMRPTADGRFVIAENRAGRIAIATVEGDKLQIETIKDGFDVAPGIAVSGDVIWVIEGKSRFRNEPALKDADAGVFTVTPLAVPKRK